MGANTWTYTFDKQPATSDDVISLAKSSKDMNEVVLPSVRAEVAAAVRKIGGSANDTDMFPALIAAIGNTQAYKMQTGTITSASTSLTFTYTAGSTVSNSYIQTSALTFKPVIIILNYYNSTSGYVYTTIYMDFHDGYYQKTAKMFASTSNTSSLTVYSFKADVSPAFVSNTGFLLPVLNANTIYNYIAFGI